MPLLVSGELKQQKESDAIKVSTKCRIPQRLPPPLQQRFPIFRTKATNSIDYAKPKLDTVITPYQRSGVRNTVRARSDEPVRPKSANRVKDEQAPCRQHTAIRSTRPERDRGPSAIPKRLTYDNNVSSKFGRSKLIVPVVQRPAAKMAYNKINSYLPDQEIIKQREDLELKQSESADVTHTMDLIKRESLTLESDKVMPLKITWQEKTVQFEKMKNELKDRQKAILELYACMDSTRHKLNALGERVSFPPPDDLRIMNVGKMTPEQLLQLCAGSRQRLRRDESQAKIPINIDINKLYNMPAKLIATCDQTLVKRTEIINFFEELKAKDKGIISAKKIHEFHAENEMLKCSLDQVKTDFSTEFDEIIDDIRKAMKKTVDLELRTEEMTLELSQLHSKNADLQKQMNKADHLKSSYSFKNKIEDLQKQLNAETCKNCMIKDQLTSSKGQVKMYIETVAQLEANLEEFRTQVYSQERTVQELHEQNKQLQNNFDKELNKLTESIKENTAHLEDIADAREKLQKEKEDLENRLDVLSEHYNGSIKNMKHEMNVNLIKFIETEKKYSHEVEEKKKVEARAESLHAQLIESKLYQKELVNKLQEQESKLNKMSNTRTELETTKDELDRANKEIEEYRNRITKQSEAIMDIECNFKKLIELEENLKKDLSTKDEYITELENKQSLLEQQLQESECKMSLYEKQLTSLKNNISELQEDFGEFENLDELHDMINEQRAKLIEATRQNGELVDALQKKDVERDRHMDNLAEQEILIEQRDGVIKMLSEKDEEKANIIKLLQNNLEIRTQADIDLNQQLQEKNKEIKSLINNVETRMKQISQLEKIILTLEEQSLKASLQIRNYQDKISLLEKELEKYIDNKRIKETPTDNIDNLIKLLEDELGTPFEPQLILPKKKYNAGDRKREIFESREVNSSFQSEYESIPTKIVAGKFVKKTYTSMNEEKFKGDDNLDRKKAITNMDTQKCNPAIDTCANELSSPQTESNFPLIKGVISHSKDNYLTRNLQFLATNQLRDEKSCKMFKFAGHRL